MVLDDKEATPLDESEYGRRLNSRPAWTLAIGWNSATIVLPNHPEPRDEMEYLRKSKTQK
jgi:hypothetical protein